MTFGEFVFALGLLGLAGFLVGLGVGFLLIGNERSACGSVDARRVEALIAGLGPQPKPKEALRRFTWVNGLAVILLLSGVGLVVLFITTYPDDPALRDMVFPGWLDDDAEVFNASVLGGFMIACFLFVIGLSLSTWLFASRIMATIQRAIGRGDYTTAMQHLETATFWAYGLRKFVEGTVLLFAGRYDKSEHAYRAALVDWRSGCVLGLHVMIANLGWAFIGQGRYEEAVELLEEALGVFKESAYVRTALAEAYLILDQQPNYALQLLVSAEMYKSQRSSREDQQFWAHLLGNKAWAHTALGEHDDADHTLDLAHERTPADSVPGMAGLHFRTAQVMRIRGNHQVARQHLEQAIRIDPDGGFAFRARAALD